MNHYAIRFEVFVGEYSLLLTRVVSSYEEDYLKLAHEYLMSYWGEENTECLAKNKDYEVWCGDVVIRQKEVLPITQEEYEVLSKYLP